MMQQQHQHQPGNLITLEGTLIADAQARVLPTDRDGHMAPVLCLDVRCTNGTQNHIRVEQPFPPGTDARCRAAAKRYRKGMQVRFQTPLAWLTLLARHTAHIHIVGPDDQPEDQPE